MNEKLPPQDLEAEESVLGAIIFDGESIVRIADVLRPGDFYRARHGTIYQAMQYLFENNEPIDIVTLTDYFRKRGEVEAIGGVAYLSSLANVVPTSANIFHHAKIILEKARQRALLKISCEISKMVYESALDTSDMIDRAEQLMLDTASHSALNTFVSARSAVKSTFRILEEQFSKKEITSGLSTGFRDLDEITSGLQRGSLVIIGARPSMGKTTLALNIAQNAAIDGGAVVAFFSLEMSNNAIMLRMLCSEAMVNSEYVQRNLIGREDWIRLTSAAGKLAEARIFLDDKADTTALEVRAKSRRLLVEQKQLDLIIVDYLQFMRSHRRFDRRDLELSEMSRGLKSLAKELNVPVVVLSQLNRESERREAKRPILADLRESGAIEQDADLILFLFREEVYKRNDPNLRGRAELIIAKHRNGRTGTVNLTFLAEKTRFVDAAGDA